MKKKITRIMTAMVLAVMMVFTAIPFASAATNNNALDETKKVSFTLNCSKPGYTFTVYKVAELKTTENPYKTGYDSLIPLISAMRLIKSSYEPFLYAVKKFCISSIEKV